MRIFAILFSLIPLGIGVTVLGFLWLTPFDQFGSPPLFFRVFASFIAFGFILFGAAAMTNAFYGPDFMAQMREQMHRADLSKRFQEPRSTASPQGYICSQCGAPLGKNPDVSPLGDVKCTHCGKWFNIHT
ncbi:hypothetical protein SH661x_001394 [Planctomicrobium sp. SH661]|uniref:hypothetical protein n=1 Tax=Planctomicrobium sp. SH661 TaxID=3448124 RepID=UPI003F5CA214